MWVLLRIAVGVMHAVQNGVSPRVQKRRTLENVCQYIKNLLPAFTEGKHFMRGIPVKKKSLEEQGKEPVCEEEDEYDQN